MKSKVYYQYCVLQKSSNKSYPETVYMETVASPRNIGKFLRDDRALSGTRWRIGWSIVLQAGRSRFWLPMGPLGFIYDFILPATLGSWDWLSL
jgi:hypothetical protein